MLSIPPKRLLEVVNPLDLELVLKLLDPLVKLANDCPVVRIQVVCCEAGGLHIVQSPDEGDEGVKVLRNHSSKGLHMSEDVVAIVYN